MKYIFKREDAFGLADRLRLEVTEKGGELWFKKCPYCGSNTNDTETFSINMASGAFKCFRSSCGKQGHFAELARDMDYELADLKPVIYKQLPQKEINTTAHAIAYLKSRGISEEVARLYRITTRKDAVNILVFPFYDEKGILQFVKYRKTDFDKARDKNKEWSEKDTMPILFGMMQATDKTKPLIVTEGQLDSLSVATAGIPNAVSVPTGANGFKWLSYCKSWMEEFDHVIVFGDYEKGKITLISELRSRLDTEVYCVRPVDYLGEKDANDILRAYGSEAIKKCIENAERPLDGQVKPLEAVESIDINDLQKIYTGIQSIDKVTGGMAVGQVVLLTGKRGDGKSTLMSQFIANALDQGESVFVYSGELADFHFKAWLDFQLAGSENLVEYSGFAGRREYRLAEGVAEKITAWYAGRAWIFDNDYLPDDGTETEKLPDVIEREIKLHNVRLICIDNLMTAMDVVTQQENLYLMQSNFVGRLKKIAMKYSVVIILVAHPRKSKTDFDNDDVSGSSDITNKVDIVMNYHRANNDSGDGNSLLDITKNRLTGQLAVKNNALKLFYSATSKRIDDNRNKRKYGWEKTDDGLVFVESEEELPW